MTVGALVTQSGPVAPLFHPYLSGVEAYFDYVNANGGVHGRKVDLRYALDDGSDPTRNINAARTLVNVRHVFALVGVATAFFSAASYLATTKTPTFGFATQDIWAGPKNFFAVGGSRLVYASVVPQVGYVAYRLHRTRVAVLSYNYGPSQAPCRALQRGLPSLGQRVVYSDLSVPFGGSLLAIDVTKLVHAGANLVVSCMDASGDVTLGTDLESMGEHGMVRVLFDGYDRAFLRAHPAAFSNSYLLLQQVPFEAAATDPGGYPGLELYLREMQRFGFGKDLYSQTALDGWQSASLFIRGLAAAGSSPTQASVLRALNAITDDTGGGVTSPIDWRSAHAATGPPGVSCSTYVSVVTSHGGASFQPAFLHGSNPWSCFDLGKPIDLSHPAAPPPGTPGG